ncbi:MAG: hypothetical protein ABR981_01485 [Candidatus Micrarchaeaceae archaeon]|jgi:hypothetical protein
MTTKNYPLVKDTDYKLTNLSQLFEVPKTENVVVIHHRDSLFVLKRISSTMFWETNVLRT